MAKVSYPKTNIVIDMVVEENQCAHTTETQKPIVLIERAYNGKLNA